MTHTSTEQQIAAAWNAQADEFNQWSELDLGEKIEWAAKWGASQVRVPLSDTEIENIISEVDRSDDHENHIDETGLARAIERAHGITQEK